jgi:hypothetical protein
VIRALFRGLKRLGRLGLRIGFVAGIVVLLKKLLQRGAEQEASSDDPQPEPPTPPRATGTDTPRSASAAAAPPATTTEVAAWVEPEAGTCPVSHPVKAKVSSKIFHEPGMLAYERTTPDRCYRDAPTAEADGFRRAKR